MITNDSWNDRRKQCPTNRKLLAVFDAGDNRRKESFIDSWANCEYLDNED